MPSITVSVGLNVDDYDQATGVVSFAIAAAISDAFVDCRFYRERTNPAR